MDVQLGKLSLKELKALAKRVDTAIANHESRKKKDALKAIEKIAKDYGMSVSEIVSDAPKKRKPGPKKKAPAAPKFRNPKDASQVWSGRGRRPEWFKAALAAGKSEKQLSI